MEQNSFLCRLLLCFAVLSATCAAAKVRKDATSYAERPREALSPYGLITQSEVRLCLADLKTEHKKEMQQLKKSLQLKDVTIVVAPDDYWYYSLLSRQNTYGAAGQDGKVLVEPVYSTCYYCPIQAEGTDEFTANSELMDAPATFHLYHPQTRGAFLASTAKEAVVVTLDGKRQATVNAPVTYFHGFLLGGVSTDEIVFSDHEGTPSLLAARQDQQSAVSLLTSDGRRLHDGVRQGFQINDLKDGHQVVLGYQQAADGVMRKGAFMLDNPQDSIPSVFGDIIFMEQDDAEYPHWLVCPNADEDPQFYNSRRNYSPVYLDDGEQLYYQERYDECATYYNNDKDMGSKPWAKFYLASAYYKQGMDAKDKLAQTSVALTDLTLHAYPAYYKERYDVQRQANKFLDQWNKAAALFSDYLATDNTAECKLYAEIRLNWLNENLPRYRKMKNDLDMALTDLDSRIAKQEEYERQVAAIEAAQRAQEQAAQSQAIAAAISNALGNISAGLAQGSNSSRTYQAAPSLRTSAARSSIRSGGRNHTYKIDNSSVNGVLAKDLPSVGGGSNSSSSSSSGGSGKTCRVCNGTGQEPHETYLGSSSAGKEKWCDICNEMKYVGHKHKTCSLCHGSGIY